MVPGVHEGTRSHAVCAHVPSPDGFGVPRALLGGALVTSCVGALGEAHEGVLCLPTCPWGVVLLPLIAVTAVWYESGHGAVAGHLVAIAGQAKGSWYRCNRDNDDGSSD